MKDFGAILAGNDLGFVTGKKALRGMIQRHTLFLVIEKLFLKFQHGDIIALSTGSTVTLTRMCTLTT
jgi:hypothetical protein